MNREDDFSGVNPMNDHTKLSNALVNQLEKMNPSPNPGHKFPGGTVQDFDAGYQLGGPKK